MNVVVVQCKRFSTAGEPLMEEKHILNATFIHCQHCVPVKAPLFHGDFTSPGKSHKSNYDSYAVSAINPRLRILKKENKKKHVYGYFYSAFVLHVVKHSLRWPYPS